MADNIINRCTQAEASRININEIRELQYWTDKLGCSSERLKQAVGAVGNSADAVRKYFRK